MGPTAVGKTIVSLAIAENRCEIISADSVQVYRYLDIGSGKPAKADRDRVRHYLIDWVDPDYQFTAGEFCREAEKAVSEITDRGKLPFIVGGTGLYIDSFVQGLPEIPEISIEVRETLRGELVERGLKQMYEELMRVDPGFGGRIHFNDTQRIMRGLEVYRGTGRPLSNFYSSRHQFESDSTLFLGLYEDRLILRRRIEERVDRMMAQGFVEEVRSLRERGYGSELRSMKSIGYAEINDLLDGRMSLTDTVEKIKTVTKQYAKRQMTWFRKNKRIHWFRSGESEILRQLVQRWIEDGEMKKQRK